MKSFFAAFVLSFVSFVSTASAGEGPQSVLQQPTVATESVAAVPACEAVVVSQPAVVCASGNCQRAYAADTKSTESCRNRLFGGKVVRKVSRTVVRPVRERARDCGGNCACR